MKYSSYKHRSSPQKEIRTQVSSAGVLLYWVGRNYILHCSLWLD